MKRAIATQTLPGDLGEKIVAAARVGFDGIEIFENDLLYFDRRPAEVRAMCRDIGLEIVSWQPFRDFEALPAATRQKAFDRAERKFDIIGELGAPMMMVCSNVSPQAIDDASRAAADLAALAERAAGRGIVVGYEALAWGRHVKDYADAWAIVRAADQPNLGIVLDTFHLFSRGNSLATMDEIPPERIMLVQLADAPDLSMDSLQHSRHYRCFPGQGEFPIVEFMQRLTRLGYDGVVSLEIFSDEFRTGSTRQVAHDGVRSMIWLDEQILEAKAPPAEVPLLSGYEFVEFATEQTAADWLEALFESLGFRKTHRHRSKNVALYRQGDVNFVINCEPDSFAHSYHERHGTSVCAVAFSTERFDELRDRTRRYLCEPFENRIAPKELDIPAIRAPDDSLLYIVRRDGATPRFFEVDFEAIGDPEHAGFGLQRIDHVGRVIAPSGFLSSLLFYRTVFEMEPTPSVDVVDPHGMVTSRALVGGGVRLSVNTSHARESISQRFLARSSGAGVQHVAMSCADIFALADALDATQLLHMPENYYDDLSARWSIDGAMLTRMRELGILYDEDANGRYFQLYTLSINGLFFEIVQREGYVHYGEANAPARIAAQQRQYEQANRAMGFGDTP
ncbi:MAG: TIM barrel protein [Gemmatimonadota bacterium]